MKIAYDHQIFTSQVYGGISKYYYHLAKELSGIGESVKIFSPFYKNKYISDLPKKVVNGRYVDHYPLNSQRIVNKYNQFVSDRGIHKYQPDIIHETFYSGRRTDKNSYKTVITVYDMIHELFDYYEPPHHRGWDAKKTSIENADHIICISENTKNDLINLYGISDEKISVTYLGFERSPIQIDDDTTINSRPYLLYVGWREWYKNFDNFLKSVASSHKLIEDFDIVLFGGGKISNKHMKLIQGLGFRANQVTQIEGDDHLLARYYQSASVFVHPSLYEGFGLTPLEAMSYNCPVVSSNTSSMPEVVGNSAELFDPENIEQMRGAIERVVYSQTRADELVKLGQERCKLFSWQQCASETLEIYNKLI